MPWFDPRARKSPRIRLALITLLIQHLRLVAIMPISYIFTKGATEGVLPATAEGLVVSRFLYSHWITSPIFSQQNRCDFKFTICLNPEKVA